MDISRDIAAVCSRIAQLDGSIAGRVDSFDTASFASLVDSPVQGGQPAVPGTSASPAVPVQIAHLAKANGAAFGIDPALIEAIVANESGFNAAATSKTGAQGLMQLEPGTAAELGISNAYDPVQNVWGGTRYLRGLLDRFHGDAALALAAYNAGPGAVEEYGGVPPYAETKRYVSNVLAAYREYQTGK